MQSEKEKKTILLNDCLTFVSSIPGIKILNQLINQRIVSDKYIEHFFVCLYDKTNGKIIERS